MPKYCAVYKCINAKKLNPLVSLFRVPTNKEERCFTWLNLMGINDVRERGFKYIYDNIKICSIHFEDGMFTSGKRQLLRDAEPTIFVNCGHNALNESNKVNILENEPSGSKQLISTSLQPTVATINVEDEENLTETESKPSSSDKLEIMALKKEIGNLKRRCKSLSSSKLSQSSKRITDEEFLKFCKETFAPNIFHFIKLQLESKRKQKRGLRYSSEMKQFALSLLFLSPKTYRFLEQSWHLPSRSSLFRITGKWIIEDGLCPFVFNAISLKVKSMRQIGRYCFLCMDEISIQKNLFYNRSQDVIYGFQDINGTRSFIPTTTCLTLMIRGLYDSWKQPLSYYFTGSSCDHANLKIIVFNTIRKLFEIGLNVVGVITDQGSNFYKLSKSLQVTPETPYFIVDEQKILFFFDTPHLLKSTRNNLFKYKLKFNEMGETDFKYIEMFYKIDRERSFKLACRLTDSHLNPNNWQKMNVALAAQILSNSVAIGMGIEMSHGFLPSSALNTIQFIDDINKLFDILNSSRFEGTEYKLPFIGSEHQIEQLKKMSNLFSILTAFDSNGKNVTNLLKFTYGWRLTINAFLFLWEQHKNSCYYYKEEAEEDQSDTDSEFMDNSGASNTHTKKIRAIFTRRINSDCLENFFGSMRQQHGNEKNPTSIQFRNGFKKLFCMQYMNHAEGANCIDDLDALLVTTIENKQSNLFDLSNFKPLFQNTIKVNPNDYIYVAVPEKIALAYVSGYLIKKTLEKHKCEICERYATENEKYLCQENYLCHLKAYYTTPENIFGNLKMPSTTFIEYIYKIEQVFCNSFPIYAPCYGVTGYIKKGIVDVPFVHPCSNFDNNYFINLFIRLRLYYTLKYYNKNLKSKDYKTLDKLKHLTHL